MQLIFPKNGYVNGFHKNGASSNGSFSRYFPNASTYPFCAVHIEELQADRRYRGHIESIDVYLPRMGFEFDLRLPGDPAGLCQGALLVGGVRALEELLTRHCTVRLSESNAPLSYALKLPLIRAYGMLHHRKSIKGEIAGDFNVPL